MVKKFAKGVVLASLITLVISIIAEVSNEAILRSMSIVSSFFITISLFCMMVVAIIDMFVMNKESKKLDKQMEDMLELRRKELMLLERDRSDYKNKYDNVVKELDRHDITVYELSNDNCILIPKERGE